MIDETIIKEKKEEDKVVNMENLTGIVREVLVLFEKHNLNIVEQDLVTMQVKNVLAGKISQARVNDNLSKIPGMKFAMGMLKRQSGEDKE